jgi:hypothetical protein
LGESDRKAVIRDAAQQMVLARAQGRGVRTGAWQIPVSSAHEATGHILDWCRQIMSGVRRPFGIDQFDLAVACGDGRGTIESRRFLRMRAADLYGETLENALRGLALQSEQGHLLFAAALFSWGDAAHQALPERLPL